MAVVHPPIIPVLTGENAKSFINKADLVSEYSKILLNDLSIKKEKATIELMQFESLTVEDLKHRVKWEYVQGASTEFLVLDNVRRWKIETVTAGTRMHNIAVWI